ncbi:uncharacterized protein LOC101451059 [Ceratitis capitata]|uniref:(Mediterranean fruit fly) hypothetical protein n=1 Tax=Ceratitis capitata TaxID=7213 RepID=W8C1G2_CERCA|nr:uncharacterized protein LOC101451059 [Ceratitis capitata]CAD6999066.1 unnamed protein product [Ceratitis capitata]
MSVTVDREKNMQATAHDEVDFSSGFETQYLQEYRPPKATVRPAPPDPSLAWYRNTMSIMMVCFLFVVLMTGSIFLIRAIFSSDPTTVVILLVAYLAVAFFFIWLEVFSKHVR